MPIISSAEAVRELHRLVDAGHFGSHLDIPTQLAQIHLSLAAKLLESAGYELAQTNASSHTIRLLELSVQVDQISELTRWQP
jgi:hypothetical protein